MRKPFLHKPNAPMRRATNRRHQRLTMGFGDGVLGGPRFVHSLRLRFLSGNLRTE